MPVEIQVVKYCMCLMAVILELQTIFWQILRQPVDILFTNMVLLILLYAILTTFILQVHILPSTKLIDQICQNGEPIPALISFQFQ